MSAKIKSYPNGVTSVKSNAQDPLTETHLTHPNMILHTLLFNFEHLKPQYFNLICYSSLTMSIGGRRTRGMETLVQPIDEGLNREWDAGRSGTHRHRGRSEESKSSLRIVGLRSISPATLVGSGKRSGAGSCVDGTGGRVWRTVQGPLEAC